MTIPVDMLEKQVVETLKTIYDPEIPVNIYDLGLIYKIVVSDNADLEVDMTLTAPNCPMADELLEMVNYKLKALPGVKSVTVKLVFEPAWDKSMLSDEAKLDMGLL